MSSKNTPISAKYKSVDTKASTPRAKSTTNISKIGLYKRSSAFDLSSTPDNENLLNKAFFSQSSSTNSSASKTPKSISALKSKSKSQTSLNACYTPSSLYKPIPLTPKNLVNTPKHEARKVTSLEQRTPECFSKVSFETPKRLVKSFEEGKSGDGEISNLTVAVRIRPMNAKELSKPAITNVMQVSGNEVIVLSGTNADNSSKVTHSFQYDHAYWSCNTKHYNYASQDMVFNGTGIPLVDNAFEGYNACLFAYGQTGSGKSYSMMGTDADDNDFIGINSEAGIIPRFCQELFKRIDNLKNKIHAEVEVSYFEIYNEKIHDLLAVSPIDGLINSANNQNKKTTLKVREHPIWGPYVVDLSTHPVDSHLAIRNWLAVGNSQRATAATGMNDKSSRSHSIFNIVLNLSEINLNDDETSNTEKRQQQTKRSKISLVDLAGSERVSHTCASGERLREGVSINKSLLTLGKVIAALADSKRNSNFVPYRESVLTWLLRENLGGNSRTVMLATISPASIHLDETLATLRYACQARTIVNRVKVNEDPHDRIIRELRAEVERLEALRQDYERHNEPRSGGNTPRKIIIETSVDESEVEALRQQLYETEQELLKAQRSWMDRLKEAENVRKSENKMLKRKGLALELSVEHRQPCLVNLAADPSLSGTLLYLIPSGIVKIGRSIPSGFDQPDIVLDGPLVAFHHCSIERKNGKLFLFPQNNDFETFVNGELVLEKRQLFHGDRLVIGGSHYFRVANPNCPKRNKNIIVDFQTAHQEILQEQENRLRNELDVEKQAALSAIEAERYENERLYNENMATLELEKFKYKCSKELLETEKEAIEKEHNTSMYEYKPFKSTLLDDIKRIMQQPVEESLHQTQMMVKEATQRCLAMNVSYEFKQTHVADEFGIFRAVINIIDHEHSQIAEWPPARLEVWLDKIRENDIAADKIFDCVDIQWKDEEFNLEQSFLNDSLNSSKISLNLSAVKDAILGSNTMRNRTPNSRSIMIKSAFRNTNVQNCSSIKKMLFRDDNDDDDYIENNSNENTPINNKIKSDKNKSKSPKTPERENLEMKVNNYLKIIESANSKLRKLCNQQNPKSDTNKISLNLLKSVDEIEFIVNEMRSAVMEKGLKDSARTPKSVRFLLD